MGLDREKIKRKTDGHCAYCGAELGATGWHCDHVIPRSQGGGWKFNNFIPACARCNLKKHAQTPDEFRIFIKKQMTKRLNNFLYEMREFYYYVDFDKQTRIASIIGQLENEFDTAEIVFYHDPNFPAEDDDG